jgi:xanthine dehydrogenase small subunit
VAVFLMRDLMKLKQKVRTQSAFYLNGRLHEVGGAEAGLMLSDYLRDKLSLTGTKVVCAEGDCGACSVLKLTPAVSGSKKWIRFLPVNACIMTVAQADGCALVTVEALQSDSKLTPVQESLKNAHASQCGFCTPGFVIAMTGLIEKKLCSGQKQGRCSAKEMINSTTGNLCRCTGYQPIIEGGSQVELSQCEPLQKRFASAQQIKNLSAFRKKPLLITGQDPSGSFQFWAPTQMAEVSKLLKKFPQSKIIGAATDLGVLHNKGKGEIRRAISLHLIPSLFEIRPLRSGTGSRVRVGARATLSELRDWLEPKIPEFANFLDLFASPQIKNSATLVGNIGNASPIADTPPFLLTTNTTLTLQGPKGARKLPFEKYYLGYRKTALKPGEWISHVEFDIPKKNEVLKLYKTSQRKDLDISAVNAAFRLEWKNHKILKAKLALGGVAATPVRLPKTEKLLAGMTAADFISKAQQTIALAKSEINPLSDLRGSSEFRLAIVGSIIQKFIREETPT